MRLIGMLLLGALAVCAADVSGTWSGRLDLGRKGKGGPFLLTLKQSGHTLSGTGGPSNDEQQPIQNTRMEGGKITFELALMNRNGLRTVCHFALTIKDDAIGGDGEVPNENGAPMPVTVSLKRTRSK